MKPIQHGIELNLWALGGSPRSREHVEDSDDLLLHRARRPEIPIPFMEKLASDPSRKSANNRFHLENVRFLEGLRE